MFNNLVGQDEREIRKNKQEYLFYINRYMFECLPCTQLPWCLVYADPFYLRKGPVKIYHNASISALTLLGVACDWLAHECL